MLAVMDTPISEFGWLPDALEPVVLRLARADACALRIGDMASMVLGRPAAVGAGSTG